MNDMAERARTQARIKEQIEQNLGANDLDVGTVRVQPDPYQGWQVAVVSPGFEGMAPPERRRVALDGLGDVLFEWIDMLTPEEAEWAGPLLSEASVEDLPLWPEAMARSLDQKDDLTFLSDLEEPVEPPITATFYSLRGGVGRSTALGYAARILADRGYTVLCVDMDLEAPGLAALFGLNGQVRHDQGVVPLLYATDQGAEPDIMEHLLRVSEADELYCLPAGRPSAEYARKLRHIDPAAYYREERNPLRELIHRLERDLTFTPDVLLFDARTGINTLSGPLLFDLSDLAIVVFFPHPQAREGTEAMVKGLLSSYTRRSNGRRLTPEPRFLASPVPAKSLDDYRLRAEAWIQAWVEPIDAHRSNGHGGAGLHPESFSENLSDLLHVVRYREAVATSDAILNDVSDWRDYEPVADWAEGFLPSEAEQRVADTPKDLRQQARAEFDFPGGTAEEQEQENLLSTFVQTDTVDKALSPKTPLVRGRKGTGKTAIFRWLRESGSAPTVTVLAPATASAPGWLPNQSAFKSIDDRIESTGATWREFWALYVGLACYLNEHEPFRTATEQHRPDLANCIPPAIGSPLHVVEAIGAMLELDDAGLYATDWLMQLDHAAQSNTLLLFDGLDTGFGNEAQDRKRRQQAIEGLFAFFLGQHARLQNLKFKILLREDIWRALSFDNKSHLFGRSVLLEWASQPEYLKVAVKHAMRSEAFVELAEQSGALRAGTYTPDRALSDEETSALWRLLVSERMRGAKTTFTRDWVWNRLTDGAGNRSPRTLLQLFDEANQWEQRQDSPYDRSVIRPRALVESLQAVSERAVSALLDEEFQELLPLKARLSDINRTPFDAGELEGLDEDIVRLAREVGLLEVYEGTEASVKRYRVPDLYRLGLDMVRKGPS